VNIITNTADRQAAIEFARAAAMRPRIVGSALQEIAREPEIFRGLFDILETQKLLEGKADIILVAKENDLVKQLSAIGEGEGKESNAEG
jgi:hypothetical protein